MFAKPECITMKLGGVTNAATRKEAVDVLRRQRGVRAATIDRCAVATVTYCADRTNVATLAAALASAGYPII